MDPSPEATCSRCGVTHELPSGSSLPELGGAISVHGDLVVEFICGPCWANRPSDDWPCAGCSKANPQWTNICSGCHELRPDPRPYAPDWDLIAKDEQDRRREGEALAAEWDREFPGWRSSSARSRDWP